MDIDQIEPGEDFVEVINRKVGTCDVAIVAIGPHWLGATDDSGKRRLDDEEDFVRMEIAAALKRNIRVIPVLVDGARMPGRHDLPEALAPLCRRNAIELSETRFHADVNRLIEAIEKPLTVAEKKTELSATPVKEPTTPMKLTQTTQAQPTIPPATSISAIAALKEPVVWRKKRLITVTAVAAMVILLLLLMISSLLTRSHPSPTTPHPSVGPSAENDYAEAMKLATGVGGTRIDLPKAAEYLQRAAAKNVPEAEARLAYWINNGVGGLAKDNVKAAQWAKKAFADGLTAKATNSVDAQTELALLYEDGLGVSEDLEKAAEVFQKAADQGYASAQNNLGVLYENGRGVPQDFGKAAELYQKAADQGHASAQHNLGFLYQTGHGVTTDFGKAAELYQKAADQGNARALYHLAVVYQNGWGVPKDLGKAVQLYQKAADQGSQAAFTRAFPDTEND